MGLLLGGLLFLGIIFIVGFFVTGRRNHSEIKLIKDEPSLSNVLYTDTVKMASELAKYIHEDNHEAIDRVVGAIDTFPNEKQGDIRHTLIQAGVNERYKRDLSSRAFKIRAASAERLGQLGGDDVPKLLFTAMADKNEEVRLAATKALKNLCDPAVAPLLVEALREPYKWLPARVAEVMVSLGKAAIPALQGALDDADANFKGYVIEILGEIGDSSSAVALYPALQDVNSNIRLQAARALGKIGYYKAVQAVLELLDDKEIKVKVQAIRSLGLIKSSSAVPYLVPLLTHQDAVVRYATLDALRHMGPEGLKAIKGAALTKGHPAAVKAEELLKEIGRI